ncbi:MAG: monomeric [FeFe] hydrogenase [Rikenellaceae bacterium]
MTVSNNAMLIRRELMAWVTRLIFNDKLTEEIDKIPVILRPKRGSSSRCCVYKDRAMLRYKLMALMGFNTQDETDETIQLSEYARMALERDGIPEIPLTVIDDACSACVKVNYVVTNMCRGCVARPCTVNCSKDAIHFENGQAHIDHLKCVNCGLCQKNCPFHAIIYTPVPCEESCPVGAISKDSEGIEHIDDSKCIYCGRCLEACPFGAINEKTHLVEVAKAIKSSNKVVAMVAPAIAGQFKAPLGSVLKAIKDIGFDDVIEVAKGANITTENEAAEFKEKMGEGQKFMTTSCCPSYTVCVEKHIPELKPFVSHTKTPIYYTARIVKEKYPDAKLVFVAPCLAKRYESIHNTDIDFMLSFEEVGSMMVARNITIDNDAQWTLDTSIYPSSRGYATSTGVASAVARHLNGSIEIKPAYISGLNKQSIKELRGFVKAAPGNIIEVMSCEGGCVNGCNVIANPKIAHRQVRQLAEDK